MNDLQSLAIYVAVIVLTLSSYYMSRRYAAVSRGLSRLSLLVAISIPVIFATIKYSSSPDYVYYLGDAIRYAQMPLSDYLAARGGGIAETARWAIARAGYGIAATPYAFFTLYSLITVGAYVAVLSKYRRLLDFTRAQEMLVAAFLFTVFYLYSLSVIDQMAAIPIFLIAIAYLTQKRYLAYVMVSILALCFHSSILIAAPIAWLVFLAHRSKVASTKRILLVAIVGVSIVMLFSGSLVSQLIGSSSVLSDYDDMYFSSEDGKYNNSMSHPAVYPLFGARLLLLAALWVFIRNGKLPKKKYEIPLVMYGLLGTILFIPSPISLLAGRVGYYFDTFMIMAIALYARGSTLESLRAKAVLIAYCAMYFIVFYGIANWAALFPLDFIWNHPLV